MIAHTAEKENLIDMEEKKLTDEEIVKALECCSNGCRGNSCFGSKIDGIIECTNILSKNALDLIHRLQDEKKELENLCNKTYDDLTKEIERLTEEHERIAWSKQEYLDWVHGFLSTHTDMKDRGEDYKMFDRDWMCNVFWEKIVGSIEYIIDLENQRNELQKQVDELKSENTELYKEHTTLIAGSIIAKQDIAKDTAKECYYKMLEECPIICDEEHSFTEFAKSYKNWLKKRYGVEVE